MAGESVRTPEELREIVDEAEGSGVIPRAQEELLHNVFDFAGREVRDVMVPSPDVVWLEASASGAGGACRSWSRHSHSRYPVGSESLDHLVGMVHVRDLIASPEETVGSLARAAMVVPMTKDLGALLRELREARQVMAIVVDEYGGTAGIVTLHDVLEELVGEIESEFDLPNNELTWIDDARRGLRLDDDRRLQRGRRHAPAPARAAHARRAGLRRARAGAPSRATSSEIDGVTLKIEEVQDLRITKLRIELSPAL